MFLKQRGSLPPPPPKSSLPTPALPPGGEEGRLAFCKEPSGGSGGGVCGSAWGTYGKWRKYLYSWGKSRRRSKQGHSTEISSRRLADSIFCLRPGNNREIRECCFVASPASFAPRTLNCCSLKRGLSFPLSSVNHAGPSQALPSSPQPSLPLPVTPRPEFQATLWPLGPETWRCFLPCRSDWGTG